MKYIINPEYRVYKTDFHCDKCGKLYATKESSTLEDARFLGMNDADIKVTVTMNDEENLSKPYYEKVLYSPYKELCYDCQLQYTMEIIECLKNKQGMKDEPIK
jgi:hypothetical protein